MLFAELSVFAGGWTLDAATAVHSEPSAVLEPLSALLDKSLVRRELKDDPPRYGMLDVIREFAGEQLSTDARRATTQRHTAFFTSLAQRAELELGTATQDRWFHALAADQENFRVALRSSINAGDAETALRLAGSLWQFWRSRGLRRICVPGPKGRVAKTNRLSSRSVALDAMPSTPIMKAHG